MDHLHRIFKFGASIPSLPRKITAEFNRHMSAIGNAISARFQHVALWTHDQKYRRGKITIASERRAQKRTENAKKRVEEALRRKAQSTEGKKRAEETAIEKEHANAQKKIAQKIRKELSSYEGSAAYFYGTPNLAKLAAAGSVLSKLYNGASVKFYTFDRSNLTDKDFKMLAGLDPTEDLPNEEKLWRETPYLEGVSKIIGSSLQSINESVNSVISKWDPMARTELVVSLRKKQLYANQVQWIRELLIVHIADVKRPELKPKLRHG